MSSASQAAGQSPAERADSDAPAGSPSGASRKALQRAKQLFEHANRSLGKGDYEYAHDLYAQCVVADPSAVVFVQHFRANLAQLYPELSQPGAAKKGGAFGVPGLNSSGRGSVAKPASKQEWAAAFQAGCGVLRKSPRDTGVLCEMAAACGELGFTDSQLYYLRWAMDIAPGDLEINRSAAAVLEAQGEFDQAIGCWVRVQKDNPSSEEAKKEIARISAEKTIDHGGYDPSLLKAQSEGDAPSELPSVATVAARNPVNEAPAPPPASAAEEPEAAEASETEEQLRAAIEADPENPAPYLALADYSEGVGRLGDAERLMRKAFELGGGEDAALLERLESVYLRRMRERSVAATQKADQRPSHDHAKEAQRAYQESLRAEVEVYEARVERTPNDPLLQYELGIRLKRAGMKKEAIVPLQNARADETRLAETHLHLGECFQHIGQHRLAMRSYEASMAACEGAQWTDLRKLACYRAGVLALGLKELDAAESLLTDLAAVDFGYRDVAERLDKLARIRDAT